VREPGETGFCPTDPVEQRGALHRRAAGPLTVAFQGELGAWSEQALRQIWGDAATPVPQRTFDDVARAVARAEVDRGVLPIHNAIVGRIEASVAAMAEYPGLTVIDETTVVIKPMLLALPGVRLGEITRVASHPAAIGQCRGFLTMHPEIAPEEAWDTAGAARDLVTSGDRSCAVIAGSAAAERYRLDILVDAIADREDNLTQFVAIAARPEP
jgi:prephenate dehydratase